MADRESVVGDRRAPSRLRHHTRLRRSRRQRRSQAREPASHAAASTPASTGTGPPAMSQPRVQCRRNHRQPARSEYPRVPAHPCAPLSNLSIRLRQRKAPRDAAWSLSCHLPSMVVRGTGCLPGLEAFKLDSLLRYQPIPSAHEPHASCVPVVGHAITRPRFTLLGQAEPIRVVAHEPTPTMAHADTRGPTRTHADPRGGKRTEAGAKTDAPGWVV